MTVELARTWLITVINPLLQGFRQEKPWLMRKNWSWRYATGTFEYLRLASDYLDPGYVDNFQPFCERYPRAADVVRAHDSRLKELADKCNVAYRQLLESPELSGALQQAQEAAAAQGLSVESVRGTMPLHQWQGLLCEYLINNVKELSSYYVTAKFWAIAHPILMQVRNSPPIREAFDDLDHSGAKALVATQNAEETLASIRNTFTREFGLPPVPLATGYSD